MNTVIACFIVSDHNGIKIGIDNNIYYRNHENLTTHYEQLTWSRKKSERLFKNSWK